MIDKFKKRIFWILFLPISILMIGIIVILTVSNCNNLIESATFMLDRLANGPEDKVKPNDFEKPKLEDVYRIEITGGVVFVQPDIDLDENIISKIKKLTDSKKDKGIIGKYIYKLRRNFKESNSINIVLMKNENIINQIKKIQITMIIAIILIIISVYWITKKISKILIKPIQDTLDKQKQFISDASHELKTPLSVIKANADVLETKVEENNKWINYIQNEIESMNKLINELLILAKSENINDIKEYSNINLSEEIKIVSAMFESIAYENKVVIENNIEENIFYNCNKEDMEHIFSTLIDNAIKHSKENNNVLVELNREKNDIQIKIKNVGEEIPIDEQKKIFERFYRVDKSRNRNSKRYGLGLSIAKTSVEKYKGNIEVYCKDGITTFKVTIPI